jgi:hypothetical protein
MEVPSYFRWRNQNYPEFDLQYLVLELLIVTAAIGSFILDSECGTEYR